MSSPRVVVVTGASGHLGHAIVAVFGDGGDLVVAHSRSGDVPPGIESVRGDLTSDADAAALVARAVELHGRIDVVVNNAADQMIGEPGPTDIARWQAMLDATLLSAVRVTSAALPHMPDGSSIINVSSVEATRAFAGRGPYAAAKAALEAYTRALAVDLGPRRIRANAVAPGLIDRDGLAESWREGHAWWVAASPSGRLVTAAEVAAAICWLSDAPGVSGAIVPLDAGWTASAASTM